ncbi:MAG: hypothetical protein JHC33_10295 [Ignisphaera sp.]|nr:hypothetical protein [Ignisphaera sp.]
MRINKTLATQVISYKEWTGILDRLKVLGCPITLLKADTSFVSMQRTVKYDEAFKFLSNDVGAKEKSRLRRLEVLEKIKTIMPDYK